jgi:hypothetical protein
VLFALDFTPSSALGAINENGLIHTGRPLAQVASRPREVTCIRGKQAGQKRLTPGARHNRAGQYHNALARETFAFFQSLHGLE